MSDNNDELVSQFLAFTGSADPSRAASYLEMSGGDLQTAVGLYMEHETGGGGGDGDLGFGGAAAAAGVATTAGTRADDVGIRAPDATRTMRLMDEVMHDDPTYNLMHAMMDEQLVAATSAFASTPPVNRRIYDARGAVNAAAANRHDDDDEEEYQYDDEEDDEDGHMDVADGPPVPPRLENMFAAPDHLIHKAGGFQGARTSAKDSKRWLLVNIQRDSEFSSHALNRDVWRDELVENLIREGFIFWQVWDTSSEGRTYIERYGVQDYPHLSIIDPRTGRLLWKKEGWTQVNPVTPEYFAEMAMDFCSRNSFDRPPQAPRPGGGGGGGSSLTTQRPATQKRPMEDMSEDEQIAAAMRASMEYATKQAIDVDDDDDDDTVEVVVPRNDTKPVAAKGPSMITELLSVDVGEEPGKGARVQFRMPDGKKVVRRFAGTDAVKKIYAFVAQSNEEARAGREFNLMAGFPPADLITDMAKTIDDCKLSGQAVNARWKE